MFDSASRLPSRPSLEQLRKQAKELLRDFNAGDSVAAQRMSASLRNSDPTRSEAVTLAEAQFVIAREYGFDNWAKLVQHVEFINPSHRLRLYERLVKDIVAVSRSDDAEALQRISELLGRTYPYPDRRTRLQQQLSSLRGASTPIAEITPADAQLIVAREFGFENWAELVDSVARPPRDSHSGLLAMSSAPPFYKIDWKENRIEPRPPLSDKDWDTLYDVMREHQITGLSANGQMTDAAIERLARINFVTTLHLGGSKRLTDEGLKHLARMPQLRELDLSEYPGGSITDRGLEVLRHLPELRRFQMCWQGGISDAGIVNLTFCQHLESVDLLGTPTGDGAIKALRRKPNLRRFKTGRLVTDTGLKLLHEFPIFETWHGGETEYSLMSPDAKPNHLLIDGPFTNEGLASMAGLEGLFGLSFFWHVTALTGEGLGPLKDLPNLGFLGCQDNLCNDEAMRHIAAIPRLRMLMGQGTVASDDGFEALSHSQTLEYIWGRECPNLGGRGFAALSRMPHLRGLAVSCKNVDDESLSTLPHFPALQGLMPMDVSDDGFRHVGRCKQLENLWCMYCRDTGDAATTHLSNLSRLKTYYAGVTRITDRSLEILGRISSLETLEFYECSGISNAGLAFLAGLPRLREIGVSGSPNVTRQGISVFPAGVRVNYR